MKTFLAIAIIFVLSSCSTAQVQNKEEQIAAAVLSLPEELQTGAQVLAYNPDGELEVIKEGTNEMICIADDPNKKGYNSACYHKNLAPFMERGRILRADGKSNDEIFDIREEEAKSGKLQMPEKASTLHIAYGSDGLFNAETGKLENTNIRYVVYIPWATSESTGLPLKPQMPGGPWIMNPGTHRAHIMITPPKEEEKDK
ncbi:MAG: hypothetical protein JXQ96_15225 [Cyclobacteriaceae bacterium]